MLENIMFDDAIGMCGYPIDIHSPDGSEMDHTFLKPGSWYSVPYRSLITPQIKNLLVAGRCISTTHEALASVRLTPIVMAMGQAAGTAVSIAIKSDNNVHSVDITELRSQLTKDGAFLEPYLK